MEKDTISTDYQSILGVGLNIKISHNFDFVLKYDLYKSIIKTEDEFTGFSLLGRVKYNFF